jgi:cyclic-di-GMP phosphodiesterase TipF (flagellum assembly factor)
MRFGAFFVGLCMLIIAASLGAVAYLLLGLSPVEALACGVTVLSLLTAYNAFAGRARDRADIAQRITDLSRGTGELARQVGEQGRRLIALEVAVGQGAERSRAVTDPLAAEIEVLGTLVKQLAESVAAHEAMLMGGAGAAPPIASVMALPPDTGLQPAIADELDAEPLLALPERQPDEMAGTIRAALEGNRIDLYLQPVVTLPQRKVRFYEAMTRLRTEDGALLLPSDYLVPAESAGLMPMLDNLMLFRSVQVVRRLTNKSRDAGLFCNIAAATLADSEFFPQFFEFLSANRALAPALVFEFTQAAVRGMGPIEHESLAQLSELGFRFSMDQVTDLQFEPRALAEQGFRFVKVPAALLLHRASATAADIHTSDFANLLARYGIDLIAEKIEAEATVIDLLDYEVRFAQGFLFAPPRPVRSEVFQAAPERAAPVLTAVPAAPSPQPAEPAALAQPTVVASAAAGAAAPPSAASEADMSGLIKLARAFGRKVS